MSKFHIGQKVVCINSTPNNACPLPLKKGKEYTIIDIWESPCCNSRYVHVGFSAPSVFCMSCKTDISKNGCWWFFEYRFAPIEEIPESHENAIKELLSNTNKIILT